ncbi:hypothetical protein F8388_014121 [Cannabis sativa]|uniref:Pyruvate kinase n=1 Tax=Cannabis sativa TaxID=3483 RepID=A0A7J6GGC3_CANSA|nr:hypothetical protein G4B88_012916 [Cannabis sativa]KAF4382001.1 hypothetical protein G4B88_006633 [Cannabis sativa]KAF4383621.1 hypothetical protein F8388_014121 [Cannabis sativa]
MAFSCTNSSTRFLSHLVAKTPTSVNIESRLFGISCSGRNLKQNAVCGVVQTIFDVSLESHVTKVTKPKVLDGSRMELDVVSEKELREKGFLGLRKTKLVCTIGPASCSLEELENLALGGMNIARLNMCHNTREWRHEVIRNIKWLNEEKGFCVSIMIDTEGFQIHVVDHGPPSSVKAEEDSLWLFTAEKFNGSRPFTIGNDLSCRCSDPGLILPRARISFWRNGKLVEKNHKLPTLSAKDWENIDFGISEGIDFVAMSYVNDAESVRHLKQYLSAKSSKSISVLAKIERWECLQKLEEIVESSDGVIIGRGDLGDEIPLEQIPTVQEQIVYVCRQLNKPVIIAAQLLESMVEYPTPTRAEVADVSEAVRQYVDALMLSSESAIGMYGNKALSVLKMTCNRMELWSRTENQQPPIKLHQLGVSLPDRFAEQICNSAAEIANNLAVDAIFVYTSHGHMASLLSRNRPNPPIFAFTNNESTRRALNLQWGVTSLLVELSDDMEANISSTISLIKSQGLLKEKDTVLVVSDVIPTLTTPVPIFQSIQVKTIGDT